MCGILGILGQVEEVSLDLYEGLIVLQHRGQDAAGIATFDNKFHIKKGNGLVRDVFKKENFLRLKGKVGVGHVRYPTAGTYSSDEAQPFFTNFPFGITFVHNGNITNANELKKSLIEKENQYFNTNSDSEILMLFFANELSKAQKKYADNFTKSVFSAIENTIKNAKGSYSVIALIAGRGLVAFRDPHGLRPLILGKKPRGFFDSWMLASESVALTSLEYEIVRDVRPGEGIYIDVKGNMLFKDCVKVKSKFSPCIFEFVYLARPDSMMDNVSVYHARLRMGQYLAEKIKKANIDIDVVIPIPETSRSTAMSLANELNLKFREGFVKNRYIGRTFIMPGQRVRARSIRQKLNPIHLEFRNRNVLLVDDSIVRGNTSKKIVELAREAGANKVYFSIACPPLRYPCVYGVDMPKKEDFVAHELEIDEIRKEIGADGIFYQDLFMLKKSVGEGNSKAKNVCDACFSGRYPTGDIDEKKLKEFKKMREEASHESVLENQMELDL